MRSAIDIPLEDAYEDVICKAMSGLGLSTRCIAKRTQLPAQTIRLARKGNFDPDVAKAIAEVLQLDTHALIKLGKQEWQPQKQTVSGLHCINTSFTAPAFGDMSVNSYIIWDETSKEALIFDSSTEPQSIIDFVASHALKPQGIFLTHTHRDHVAGLPFLLKAYPDVPHYAHKSTAYDNASPLDHHQTFEFGSIRLQVRFTPGHSADGTSFIVDGLSRKVAIIGDTLFAASVGGAGSAWQYALENIDTQILSLPEQTLLCPGHGPLTTVAEEKQHNPIIAGFLTLNR